MLNGLGIGVILVGNELGHPYLTRRVLAAYTIALAGLIPSGRSHSLVVW